MSGSCFNSRKTPDHVIFTGGFDRCVIVVHTPVDIGRQLQEAVFGPEIPSIPASFISEFPSSQKTPSERTAFSTHFSGI